MTIPDSLATAAATLPADGCAGTLVGRVWDPAAAGPCVVAVREAGIIDLTEAYPTVRDLCETDDPAAAARAVDGRLIGSLADVLDATRHGDSTRPRLLGPVDLQTLKAAGVTFAVSMIERVIEERVRGDFQAAAAMREQILVEIGADLSRLVPGSEEASRLKEFLTDRGLWSQYLEVGIGPDAEIFTKAPSLAAVGTLASVGVPETSSWNNPEPEVAVVTSSAGRIVGAMLGNDVNLRDVEGRSALLLPQAKDNNASCSLGPLLRLFDDTFTLDTVRGVTVGLEVYGEDGFELRDTSPMSQISRDPADLVAQLFRTHDYPDGVVLMLGTLFAPVKDRDVEGVGFTHKQGDVVRIAAQELGGLVNQVQHCHHCEPWTFGLRDLMTNLAGRGLL
jgi:fumarylacetoacetate (FAA) hydrolase family protein